MWDNLSNTHLFTAANLNAAQVLIDLVTQHNMSMVLPPSIPTPEASNTKNLTRVDNVFCSTLLHGRVLSCAVDPMLRPPLTDYFPIIIELALTLNLAPDIPKRDWRKVVWDDLNDDLKQELGRLG